MERELRFYFDKEADVLYFSKGRPSADAISREVGDDIIVRLEPDTGKVVGFTILNLTKRFEKVQTSLGIPLKADFALT